MKTYDVYNGFDSRMFSEDFIIEAKTSAEAVKKVLQKIGIKFTSIKHDKSNLVRMRATPFHFNQYHQRVREGRDMWYRVLNGDTILQ